MPQQQDEFVAFFWDGRKRRLLAGSFESAREIFHAIGVVESMDYADCLWELDDPAFLPLQSGSMLGIYG